MSMVQGRGTTIVVPPLDHPDVYTFQVALGLQWGCKIKAMWGRTPSMAPILNDQARGVALITVLPREFQKRVLMRARGLLEGDW